MGTRKNHNNNQFVKRIDHIHKFGQRPPSELAPFRHAVPLMAGKHKFHAKKKLPPPTVSLPLDPFVSLEAPEAPFYLLSDFRLWEMAADVRAAFPVPLNFSALRYWANNLLYFSEWPQLEYITIFWIGVLNFVGIRLMPTSELISTRLSSFYCVFCGATVNNICKIAANVRKMFQKLAGIVCKQLD